MLSKPIEVILAATPSGEIGYRNTLPWHLKGDLKRFRDITMGNIVVIGKNTYESLPGPLDGRTVIVVSNSLARSTDLSDSVHFVPDLNQAIILSKKLKNKKMIIAGGVRLYETILQFPCTVHLTTVYKRPHIGYDTRIKNFNLWDFDLQGEPEAVYEINPKTGIVEVSHIYSTYWSKNLILHG